MTTAKTYEVINTAQVSTTPKMRTAIEKQTNIAALRELSDYCGDMYEAAKKQSTKDTWCELENMAWDKANELEEKREAAPANEAKREEAETVANNNVLDMLSQLVNELKTANARIEALEKGEAPAKDARTAKEENAKREAEYQKAMDKATREYNNAVYKAMQKRDAEHARIMGEYGKAVNETSKKAECEDSKRREGAKAGARANAKHEAPKSTKAANSKAENIQWVRDFVAKHPELSIIETEETYGGKYPARKALAVYGNSKPYWKEFNAHGCKWHDPEANTSHDLKNCRVILL